MVPLSMTGHSMKLFELLFRIDVSKSKLDENQFGLFVCNRGHLTEELPGSKRGSYPISYRVSVTRLSVCILFQNDLSAISSRFKIDF